MTDKFFSGWGHAANGRIDKLVVECDTIEQAEQIERAAHRRPEMRYINLGTNRPRYSPKRYTVSYKHYSELSGRWLQ